MNISKETQAIEYMQMAQKLLKDAVDVIKSPDEGDIYQIIDKTTGKLIDEKPTFLTARNVAVDYLEGEDNKTHEILISRGQATIKK